MPISGVTAQEPGTITLGAYGGFSFHDDDSGLTDVPTVGVGGTLGIIVLPSPAVEGDVSHFWIETIQGLVGAG